MLAMHPFLLTFRNNELEQQYDTYTNSRLKQDRIYSATQVAVHSGVAIRLAVTLGLSYHTLIAVTVVTLFCVELALRCGGPPEWKLWLARNREKMGAITWVFHALMIGIALPHWMLDPEEVPAQSITEIVAGLFIVSACMQQFHTGLGLRLRFKYHVIIQALTCAWYLFCVNKECCARAMQSQEASSLILKIVLGMDGYLVALLEVFYTMFGYTPSPRIAEGNPCLHLTSFFHICLGFVVCSYIVWILERSSRIAFLDSLGPDEKSRAQITPMDSLVILLHGLLLSAAVAVCWRVASDVVFGVEYVGLGWKYG